MISSGGITKVVSFWVASDGTKYGISYRELEEMMLERGLEVDHTTIYRWIQHYAPEMEKRMRWY